MFNKIKQSFKDYLNRMAKINKEEFGGNTLDCCKLNKRPVNKNNKHSKS